MSSQSKPRSITATIAMAVLCLGFVAAGSPSGCVSPDPQVPPEPVGKAIKPSIPPGAVVTKKKSPRKDEIPEIKSTDWLIELAGVIEDPTMAALDPFFDELWKCEQGEDGARAAVLHFGDSHTAADFLTGTLRRLFQKKFGDAGHGFMVASKPYKSYRHMDVQNGGTRKWLFFNGLKKGAEPPFGLGGFKARSKKKSNSAWIATDDKGDLGVAASLFEVFYLKQPKGGRFKIFVDGKYHKTVKTKYKTKKAGFEKIVMPEGPHKLEVKPYGDKFVDLFGFVMERESPGVVYDCLGINGAQIIHLKKFDWSIMTAHIAHRDPSLIVTAYGTNELFNDNLDIDAYQKTYATILGKMREAAPDAACLVMGPPDTNWAVDDPYLGSDTVFGSLEEGPVTMWKTPAKLEAIIDAQRKAAFEVGCAFFDTYSAMGGKDSMHEWVTASPQLGREDHVHFTIKGYERLAESLFNALMRLYKDRKIEG